MGLAPELLAKLVCPKCHGPLKVVNEGMGLDCSACKLRYKVEKFGEDVFVPDMIIEHAQEIRSQDESRG
jgi:uncharacterized protein YbaR (Trm112 family)